MKIQGYCLTAMCFFILNTVEAADLSVNLSQNNKKIDVELKGDDVLSVNYDLSRKPIFRYHEWFSYVLRCDASNQSVLEYHLNEQTKYTTLPAILSNDNDQQKIGLNMDESGIFKIKNNSHKKIHINCELFNKFGR
jgi:hypothetical protein